MTTGSKTDDAGRNTAVDYVKTAQEVDAKLTERSAAAKARDAARPTEAPETDDSPKHQGDKLGNAVRAAAGEDAPE